MPRLLLIILLLPMLAEARLDSNKYILRDCTPSLHILNIDAPKKTHNSNNLRKKTGQAWFAKGTSMRLQGVVLNQDCIPLYNAKIEIWHNDTKGIAFNEQHDRHFSASGRQFTNNEGEFEFLTIIPGTISGNETPHINIRIKRDGYKDLITKLYFPLHKMNNNDPFFLKYRNQLPIMEHILHDNYEDKIYNIQLILRGNSKHKFY